VVWPLESITGNTGGKHEATHTLIVRRLWLPKINPSHIAHQLLPAIWIDKYWGRASIAMTMRAMESHIESFVKEKPCPMPSWINPKIALEYLYHFLKANPATESAAALMRR